MNSPSVFKIYLIYFVSMCLFCVLRILSSFDVFNFMHPDIADIVFTVLIQIGLMFLLPLILYTIFNRKVGGLKTTFKYMKFNKIGIKVILISVLIGILAFLINIAVSTVFGGILSLFGYKQPISGIASDYNPLFPTWLSFILQIITVAVLPAFCEEFLHRGILLQGTYKIGVKKAIVISSIMFGLIHFNINQFFYASILGMLMALVAIVSKSIYPAMIIHFMNNFISVYLTSAESYGWFGKNFYNYLNNFLQSSNGILTFFACFLFLALVIFALIWLIGKLFKISTLNKVQKVINNMYTEEDKAISNSPIIIEKSKMLQDMLENNTTLNLNFEEMKSPLDVVLPKQKNIYKPKLQDNLFMISAFVLGGIVTLFTFIWGLI